MTNGLITRCLLALLPTAVKKQLINFRILSKEYGQYGTIRRWESVDRFGSKMPWYTYPAIEYLSNLDFGDKLIFEYGSGNSSSYWASKAKTVVSVEHDQEWYEKVEKQLAGNQRIYLSQHKNDYLDVINRMPEKFDVIIIDGMYRAECAKLVRHHLSSGGMVILDNSDWYKETSKYLREELDLIEVDFHGFGPINAYTWTTSLFFSRDARFQPLNSSQPHYSVAAVENCNDAKSD